MGVEKKHSRANMRGPAAAAPSEGGERAGVAGPQAGPRAPGGAAAMVLARLASLGRAAGCEAHFFFSFFLFSVLFHLFEFKFGFKNWCTKFIRVLDM